jgi:hypothetical protein
MTRLGFAVTVAERSPARAVDGGGGLGVDVDLLREVTGIGEDPPGQHGIDRDTTAWHLLQSWLEEHASRASCHPKSPLRLTASRPVRCTRGPTGW